MVDPTPFIPQGIELEAIITDKIAEIASLITSAATLLSEDETTGEVSVIQASYTQFNTKMRLLNNAFVWFKELLGYNKAFELQSAFATDYTNANKQCYIIDRVIIANK